MACKFVTDKTIKEINEFEEEIRKHSKILNEDTKKALCSLLSGEYSIPFFSELFKEEDAMLSNFAFYRRLAGFNNFYYALETFKKEEEKKGLIIDARDDILDKDSAILRVYGKKEESEEAMRLFQMRYNKGQSEIDIFTREQGKKDSPEQIRELEVKNYFLKLLQKGYGYALNSEIELGNLKEQENSFAKVYTKEYPHTSLSVVRFKTFER